MTEAKAVAMATGIAPTGAVALLSLALRNVLSFGAEAKVELGPLNVLIGPNGCGKSNLVDVMALLKAAATTDLSDEFRGGGLEWPWKGATEESLKMEMGVDSMWLEKGMGSYDHRMAVRVFDTGAYAINTEWLDYGDFGPFTVSRGNDADSRLSILRVGTPLSVALGEYPPSDVELVEKVRGSLSAMAGGACIYRNRYTGRAGRGQNPLRVAGRADELRDKVSESLTNFPNVLNRIYAEPACKKMIDEKMREFYEDARGIYFNVAHGAVEIVLQEAGGRATPASRMSDGMLNWLFLLTVLLDPKPPALVCIEEPETGLHPDMLPTLARMLIDASKRMQLIVTTHSDMILDCFTNMPEAVVVCDKVDGVTQMTRLCAKDFREWKKEGLGMAWISGAIGGKRW